MAQINREQALSHPFANGQYDKEHADEHFIMGFEDYKEWLEDLPTVEAIPIPKDATNGDILRTIFPKAKHELQKFYEKDTIVFDLDGFYMRISSDWWNSPYKENKNGNVD